VLVEKFDPEFDTGEELLTAAIISDGYCRTRSPLISSISLESLLSIGITCPEGQIFELQEISVLRKFSPIPPGIVPHRIVPLLYRHIEPIRSLHRSRMPLRVLSIMEWFIRYVLLYPVLPVFFCEFRCFSTLADPDRINTTLLIGARFL
jgi:hypothetical protein